MLFELFLRCIGGTHSVCVGRAGATGQAQGKLHYSGLAGDGGDGREHAKATACSTHDWQLEDSSLLFLFVQRPTLLTFYGTL